MLLLLLVVVVLIYHYDYAGSPPFKSHEDIPYLSNDRIGREYPNIIHSTESKNSEQWLGYKLCVSGAGGSPPVFRGALLIVEQPVYTGLLW